MFSASCEGPKHAFLLGIVVFGCMVSNAFADEASNVADASAGQPGVNLLAADSLAGWTYGPEKPAGWTIEKGVLTGAADATPLVSGYSVGDFELHVNWSVKDGGAIRLGMLRVPEGEGIELRLAEDPGVTIRLPQGARSLKTSPAKLGKTHSTIFSRTGDKFTLTADGVKSREMPVDANWRFGLALAIEGAGGVIESMRLVEPGGEPLFNGVDFKGWQLPKGMPNWEVKEGMLCGIRNSEPKQKVNYVRTAGEYGNFTLSFEYNIHERGNSGVGIRTPRGGWPSRNGMELQILDQPDVSNLEHLNLSHMAIYKHVEPLGVLGRAGEWNRVTIKADGPMVSAWINGELAQHCNTAQVEELKHRPASGWIGFQFHRDPCQFRNITLLEAPKGNGLAIWTQSAALSGDGRSDDGPQR